jgi:1D-myo-inositol-tetrakisphosphate 5-kinase/inositol-polyphosphate multikinase
MGTSSLVYFDQQVAGHRKLMSMSTSDLIVIKPCKKKELDFYQDAHSFPEFQDFLPECYGTVRAATEKDLNLLDNAGLENDTVKIDTSLNIDHILFKLNLMSS